MVVYINKDKIKMSEQDSKGNAFRRVEDWERLAVLEVRVNDHEEDLKVVLENQSILSQGVADINTTLNRILWVAAGSFGTVVAHEVGVLQAVGAVLGINIQ